MKIGVMHDVSVLRLLTIENKFFQKGLCKKKVIFIKNFPNNSYFMIYNYKYIIILITIVLNNIL